MGISLALKNNWMRRFSVLFAIMVVALCVWLDLLDRQRHSHATPAAGIHLERPDGDITRLPPLDGIRSSVVYHANSQIDSIIIIRISSVTETTFSSPGQTIRATKMSGVNGSYSHDRKTATGGMPRSCFFRQ
jgi:hypothetical protein